MNSFDFIITIALGSTFSSGILQKSVALADTIFALAVLIGLQYLVTWLSVRNKTVNRLVKSEPKLVFRHGDFLWSAMRSARVTEDEIKSAIRMQGIGAIDQVEAIVLETNGKLAVIGKSSGVMNSVLLVP